MAQPKSRQQSPDLYAQRGKALGSLVQRLRGWVGSDPSREPELADALVELTAHRLLGHGYAMAAADAQESVRRAGELLAAKGPIGPYTSIGDAARYVTAAVHLGTIQAGLGLPDAAGRTIDSLQDMRDQLRGKGLEQRLSRRPLSGHSHAAPGPRWRPGMLLQRMRTPTPPWPGWPNLILATILPLPISRWTSSDSSRTAGGPRAGLRNRSAMCTRRSRGYDDVVDRRLAEPARLSPALLERLAEPLFGLYRDLADRLAGSGESEVGLITRRRLTELLGGLAGRLGDPVRVQLAAALADLAHDLSEMDRVDEAKAVHAEADAFLPEGSETAVQDLTRGTVSLGGQAITWAPLPATLSYAATTAPTAATKIVDLAALQAARQRDFAVWLRFARPQARRLEHERKEQVRIDAERRGAERDAAERAVAEKLAAERVEAAHAERLEADRQAAAEEAQRLERKRRREERLEAHRLELEQREAEQREAQRLEAERLEAERLQAEIDQLGAQRGQATSHGLNRCSPNRCRPIEKRSRGMSRPRLSPSKHWRSGAGSTTARALG